MLKNFLKNHSYSETINRKRVDLLFENFRIPVYRNTTASIIVAILIYDKSNVLALITWILLHTQIGIIRIILLSRFKRQRKLKPDRHQFYINSFFIFILISGLLWGAGFYYFVPTIDNEKQFVAFVLIIMILSSGSVTLAASSLLCSLAFILPTFTFVLLKIFHLELFLLLNYILLFFVFLIWIAYHSHHRLIRYYQLDEENIELIQSLTHKKDISEQAIIKKSQFLAAASHDLRQPLNSMGLFLYALREKLKGDPSKSLDQTLVDLDHSYFSLNKLFDALLTISRVDAGTMDVEIESVKLKEIIQPIIDNMQKVALEKKLVIHYQSTENQIETDPLLLSQMISNLVDNAIKYTSYGSITILESIESDSINIQIQDTGEGISCENLENIFKEYQQLSKQKNNTGLGLGLSIVKKIGATLGVTVSVSSVEGQGSIFSLLVKRTTNPEINMSLIDASKVDESLKNIKVLVIDDEPNILKAMNILLFNWQCKVDTAETYDQALECALKDTPDVILCDYRLHDNMTGIQALASLQRELKLEIPSIIISGDTNPAILKTIKQHDLNLLFKPIQPATLYSHISHIVREKI